MTKREAVRLLKGLGFRMERGRKHEKWIHPDGRMLTLSGGSNEHVWGYVGNKIRKWALGRFDGKQGGLRSDRGGGTS